MLAYGLLLVLLVFFLPRGIVPTIATRRRSAGGDVPQEGSSREIRRSNGVTAPLVVEDLAVAFGGVAALGGVSFEVRPGTITSLIGPNGAGKTTAFNAITGYLRPRRGRVAWDGVPLAGRRPCEIAQRGIVRTFQKTSVFPALSVRDNVMVGLHLRGSAGLPAILGGRRAVREEDARLTGEAESVMAFVGLTHRRDEPASALPYGEQRLVELAVALAARPRLLLLDEPGAGMTGGEKERLIELIRRLRDDGLTVLLVEHDMRLVMGISDTVIVLNHGRVIAEGAPAVIQAHPDVIRAYLGAAARA
jgi:branched-chain amino acid transport system ATP-binding protein